MDKNRWGEQIIIWAPLHFGQTTEMGSIAPQDYT